MKKIFYCLILFYFFFKRKRNLFTLGNLKANSLHDNQQSSYPEYSCLDRNSHDKIVGYRNGPLDNDEIRINKIIKFLRFGSHKLENVSLNDTNSNRNIQASGELGISFQEPPIENSNDTNENHNDLHFKIFYTRFFKDLGIDINNLKDDDLILHVNPLYIVSAVSVKINLSKSDQEIAQFIRDMWKNELVHHIEPDFITDMLSYESYPNISDNYIPNVKENDNPIDHQHVQQPKSFFDNVNVNSNTKNFGKKQSYSEENVSENFEIDDVDQNSNVTLRRDANLKQKTGSINFNSKIKDLSIPNDPYFHQQWALYNPQNRIDIRALEAHKLIDKMKKTDVIVALIDTGVDLTHQDLGGRFWVNNREIPNNGIDDDGLH